MLLERSTITPSHLNLEYRPLKTSAPVEMTRSGLISFPEIADRTIRENPYLETFIYEMAALDPDTFLHQVMTTECYILLREEYVRRIMKITPPDKLREIDMYLRSQDTSVMLHDMGKWTITSNPHLSVAIVNSKPPPEHVAKNGDRDHRINDHRNLHKLHPTTGAYTAISLGGINPLIPPNKIYKWAKASSTHHEHFIDKPVFDLDGSEIKSYPRSELRLTDKKEEVFYLLLKMADTVVACGQPRIYREFRYPPAQIEYLLNNILVNYFQSLGFIHKSQDIAVYIDRFRNMAMEALSAIQIKYPENVCRELKGFNDDAGNIFPPKVYQEGYLLGRIAENIWHDYEDRFENEASSK